VKITKFKGDLPKTNRGRAPSAETLALVEAIRESAETGEAFQVEGLSEMARATTSQRLRVLAKNEGLSMSIYSIGDELVVLAKSREDKEEEPDAEPEPVPVAKVATTTRPRRTSRK